jgi:hypothetical protein
VDIAIATVPSQRNQGNFEPARAPTLPSRSRTVFHIYIKIIFKEQKRNTSVQARTEVDFKIKRTLGKETRVANCPYHIKINFKEKKQIHLFKKCIEPCSSSHSDKRIIPTYYAHPITCISRNNPAHITPITHILHTPEGKRDYPTPFQIPNTYYTRPNLKRVIPTPLKCPNARKRTPITPLLPASKKKKNENYSGLRKPHFSKTHHASCSIVLVTYLGLTCCSNGSDAPAAPSPSCSCSKLLLLADLKSSPVPPSQTLGVLFFPLSPPSRKGATHNQKVLAPQLASKAELPLTMMLRLPNSYQ